MVGVGVKPRLDCLAQWERSYNLTMFRRFAPTDFFLKDHLTPGIFEYVNLSSIVLILSRRLVQCDTKSCK